MLADAPWVMREPLVEQGRPKAKPPPQDLRRTLKTILWRHENAAKWRAVPAERGPGWRAAQTFIRWARLGVWERLLNLVQERGIQFGMASQDGTKACVIADSLGRAVAFRIAPGQAHELPDAIPLIDTLPGVPDWVVADRGYSSHRSREPIWGIGAKPVVPASPMRRRWHAPRGSTPTAMSSSGSGPD